MSSTNRHKYKYFHSTVQRAKDRQQKFHFCRLPFDVRPRNVKLNLSIITSWTWMIPSSSSWRDLRVLWFSTTRPAILFLFY